MKKLRLIASVAFIFIFTVTEAQEKGIEELKIGYGIITSTQVMYDMGEIFATAFTLGGITYKDETSYGSLYINYNYSISDKFTLGGLVAYEQVVNKVLSNGSKIGTNRAGFYTFAFEAAFRYVRNDNFQMYSGLGLAYTYGNMKFDSSTSFEKDDESSASLPNFHLTGVGFRFGGKFGGIIELGFGYKGIVNAGISFQM